MVFPAAIEGADPIVAILVAILSGSLFGGFVQLRKMGPERQSILITSQDKVLANLTGELQRTYARVEHLEKENAELRERVRNLELMLDVKGPSQEGK